ncbi:MAG: acetate--CoA ligase family protein [Actinobacteria bacterium]|nr:MAG: acetate--CoA ligase family protein [Actinomycetota bacterium]
MIVSNRMARTARHPTPLRLDVTGRPVELRAIDLDTFFHPRTVAVVGASDTPGRPNTAMTRKVRDWAEKAGAAIYPVNPNRPEVDGLPSVPTILDIPVDVDLAAILVGEAVHALEEAVEKKARFAVVFAAGFAEVGGEGTRLQARLEQLVKSSELHLLGPNTNLNAFETFRDDLAPPTIALITQSGHQGRPIFQGQDLGIALSHWAPTGNEVDLEVADFVRYFADQDEVGVIAAYVEGFKDGRTLMLAADHAAGRGVPIVVVKVGRTDEGRSMAMAHTGHLAGSDAVISAALRQLGVIRVDGLDELLDTSALLARAKPPTRPGASGASSVGVCVYSISGGTGAHMADLVSAAGLRLPSLSLATQDQLRQWIPSYLRVSNPVDNGGHPSTDWRGRKILDAIVADPAVDVVICPITGALPSMSKPLARDLVDVAATTDKPICVVWGSPVDDDVAYREILLGSRLPVFRTFANCVRAVRSYVDYHEFRQRHVSPFSRPAMKPSTAARRARPLLRAGEALSEHSSKEVLAAYGIPVTCEVLATSAAQAVRAAADLGPSVVMKISSPELPHKADLGLVELGVTGAGAVRTTYARLLERAGAAAPGAAVEGVLVSELVTDGTEAVLGVADDELFGPTVMLGIGGVFVEVLQDVTFRVPPFDRGEARRMVSELRGSALLTGARGRQAADTAALVDAIMRVQRLAVDLAGEVAELDINPLVVRAKGAVAVDALVVCR